MVENINWLSITEDDVADDLIMNISPNDQRYQFIDFWMWNYLGDAFQIVYDKEKNVFRDFGQTSNELITQSIPLSFLEGLVKASSGVELQDEELIVRFDEQYALGEMLRVMVQADAYIKFKRNYYSK
ncbi:hypothetical protein [Limosilactobacillus ingluviei]|uniref:hypothetical protein n=1 Tax=Limosilactobacillus ingluviei TaxID=148604 RepID=UPI0023F42081|nr:hypothetical protein [Limosilactobacillus ingluviei]